MKMVIIFIIILAIGALIAVWFNYWNHKNPVGSRNKKPTKLNLQQQDIVVTEQDKEQTKRIIQMFNNRSAV
jgi:uncharacterized protein YpmB